MAIPVCDACVTKELDTMVEGGIPGGLKPLRMCNWAAPTYGDMGRSAVASMKQAAMLAVSILNTIAQVQIAQKRYDIARDYARIAEDRWERFKDDYMPFEKQFLYETSQDIKYQPQYPESRERYTTYARNAYSETQKELADQHKKYGMHFSASTAADLELASTIAQNDGINFGYRDEENYAITKLDTRWTRRSALLDLGRDIHANALSYAQSANETLAQVGNLANSAAQGAMAAFGYSVERRELSMSADYALTGTSSKGIVDNSLFYTGETAYNPY